MINLICETSTEGTNYLQAIIAFFVIMTIIGFVLIMIDKKRWKAHVARSNEMNEMRSRKKVEPEAEVEDGDVDSKDGKKKKKKAKSSSQGYEYEGRIKDRALIPIAILFGGIGELLGMIIFRHKWYSNVYKIAMPIIAFINLAFMIIICFAFLGVGGDGFHFTA